MTEQNPIALGSPPALDSVRALLDAAKEAIRCFELKSLETSERACSALIDDTTPLDVAVVGQFKSGKSSLLNALLGSDLLPVGAVPVTAVITRLRAGEKLAAKMIDLDGHSESIALSRIADFITETLNPGNVRRVAVVDIEIPTLRAWPNLQLVDTPGLGSTFGHNTQTTKAWLPNVAAALVVVSADRPLSDEDRQLIADARQFAPRVWVILSKVDLLNSEQQAEVMAYLVERIQGHFQTEIPVIPFSIRRDRDRWVAELRDKIFRPLVEEPQRERRAVFTHKVKGLASSCAEYLQVALKAAVQISADRARMRTAILDETVREAVIRDELKLAAQGTCDGIRPAFAKRFEREIGPIQHRLVETLRTDMPSWRGHLGQQTCQYQEWIREHLTTELAVVSAGAGPLARDLLANSEVRFRRVVEAFRDRLARNVTRELNVTLSPVAWDLWVPDVVGPDASFSKTFDTSWELLWWAIPMPLFGWLFRRHVLGLVPWEIEKNLHRLVSDWYDTVAAAVAALMEEAAAWVSAEIATLNGLLDRQPDDVAELEDFIRRLRLPSVACAAIIKQNGDGVRQNRLDQRG